MSYQSIDQRILNVSLLVRSFATASVREVLQPCGLTPAEIERGNQLLAAARRSNQSFRGRVRYTPNVTAAVAWSKTRFVLIDAVLDDVAPDVREHVFESVDHSNMVRTLFSIESVCERVLALELGETADEAAAWKALGEHGVTKEELLHVTSLLADQARFVGALDAAGLAGIAEREAAVTAAERFHKKWARIARSLIKDRPTLQMMGLTTIRRTAAADEALAEPAEKPETHEVTPG